LNKVLIDVDRVIISFNKVSIRFEGVASPGNEHIKWSPGGNRPGAPETAPNQRPSRRETLTFQLGPEVKFKLHEFARSHSALLWEGWGKGLLRP
jgi:hypothetical protein